MLQRLLQQRRVLHPARDRVQLDVPRMLRGHVHERDVLQRLQ